jgi:hypothetical protein
MAPEARALAPARRSRTGRARRARRGIPVAVVRLPLARRRGTRCQPHRRAARVRRDTGCVRLGAARDRPHRRPAAGRAQWLARGSARQSRRGVPGRPRGLRRDRRRRRPGRRGRVGRCARRAGLGPGPRLGPRRPAADEPARARRASPRRDRLRGPRHRRAGMRHAARVDDPPAQRARDVPSRDRRRRSDVDARSRVGALVGRHRVAVLPPRTRRSRRSHAERSTPSWPRGSA